MITTCRIQAFWFLTPAPMVPQAFLCCLYIFMSVCVCVNVNVYGIINQTSFRADCYITARKMLINLAFLNNIEEAKIGFG